MKGILSFVAGVAVLFLIIRGSITEESRQESFLHFKRFLTTPLCFTEEQEARASRRFLIELEPVPPAEPVPPSYPETTPVPTSTPDPKQE
jgi:hypothetical protein